MSEKITFSDWFANFSRGIWQALYWLGRVFNPRYKTRFWRVVWAVITLCVVTVTGLVVYDYIDYHTRENRWDTDIQVISDHFEYVKPSGKSGYIRNSRSGLITERGLQWVAMPADEDSLIVFSRGNRRGYINRYTGRTAISERYDRAWVFSGGLAAVCEGDSVFFITPSGTPAGTPRFAYDPKAGGYVYHGNYCAMPGTDGLLGLIDRSGRWAVEPRYERLTHEARDFWCAREGDAATGLWYAFDDNARMLTPCGFPAVTISEDIGVVATLPDHLQVCYGFDGTPSADFLIYDVERLYYDKDEWDKDGNPVQGVATLMLYRMSDGYEGLCTPEGRLVTKPLFWHINTLGKNTYLCKYKDDNSAVIVDSSGQIVARPASD